MTIWQQERVSLVLGDDRYERIRRVPEGVAS